MNTLKSINVREVELLGMRFAHLDSEGLLSCIMSGLENRQGGWVLTANLDILRQHHVYQQSRELYNAADICVADGMPLVWASRLQGDGLPERVAGSSFVWTVAEEAARLGYSLYLLGGAGDSGLRTGRVLRERFSKLKIVGASSPKVSSPISDQEFDAIERDIALTNPDIVLLAFGSPKQDFVCERLRQTFKSKWFIGVGYSFSFASGDAKRAPKWMQRWGLEWLHRMLHEPRRLTKRYLIEDAPFALKLFADASVKRLSSRPPALPRAN